MSKIFITIVLEAVTNPTLFKISLTGYEAHSDTFMKNLVATSSIYITDLDKDIYKSKFSLSVGEPGVAYVLISYVGVPDLNRKQLIVTVQQISLQPERHFYIVQQEGYQMELTPFKTADCKRSAASFNYGNIGLYTCIMG